MTDFIDAAVDMSMLKFYQAVVDSSIEVDKRPKIIQCMIDKEINKDPEIIAKQIRFEQTLIP